MKPQIISKVLLIIILLVRRTSVEIIYLLMLSLSYARCILYPTLFAINLICSLAHFSAEDAGVRSGYNAAAAADSAVALSGLEEPPVSARSRDLRDTSRAAHRDLVVTEDLQLLLDEINHVQKQLKATSSTGVLDPSQQKVLQQGHLDIFSHVEVIINLIEKLECFVAKAEQLEKVFSEREMSSNDGISAKVIVGSTKAAIVSAPSPQTGSRFADTAGFDAAADGNSSASREAAAVFRMIRGIASVAPRSPYVLQTDDEISVIFSFIKAMSSASIRSRHRTQSTAADNLGWNSYDGRELPSPASKSFLIRIPETPLVSDVVITNAGHDSSSSFASTEALLGHRPSVLSLSLPDSGSSRGAMAAVTDGGSTVEASRILPTTSTSDNGLDYSSLFTMEAVLKENTLSLALQIREPDY
jgi:hypothetical protein